VLSCVFRFRLERALEVSLIAGEGAKAFTGERVQKLGEYDLRCFFLVAPREPLCRVIDQR
jgi:tRNA A37 N6-isopentenylltransferase MiaA